MKRKARIHQHGNDENNLNKFRVESGLTLEELGKRSDCHAVRISALINGMESPVYLTGKRFGDAKPHVERIAGALKKDLFDLFPRYFCKLYPTEESTSEPEVLFENCISEHSLKNAEGVEVAAQRKKLKEAVLSALENLLTPTEKHIIIKRFGFDDSIIGTGLNISLTRIYQLEKRAMRKLRQNLIRNVDNGETRTEQTH